MRLEPKQFRDPEQWAAVWGMRGVTGYAEADGYLIIPPFWSFDHVGVIPFDAPLALLQLVLGSHDPAVQIMANRYFPCWVFNLSITPSTVIESTHQRMQGAYHPDGGAWHRSYMPRTSLIFLNGEPQLSRMEQRAKAKAAAHQALENYWRAMEGTLDLQKIAEAVENAVYGNPEDVARQLAAKYHADDRLMLWFDFNNHDNRAIKSSMDAFWNQTRPMLLGGAP